MNIDSTDREIQQREIPVPYKNTRENSESQIQVEIEEEEIYETPNDYNENQVQMASKRSVKEFNMKLDTSSPRFIISTNNNDNIYNRINELELALRNEILKNEETQALNLALKEMIENFQFGDNNNGDYERSKESVKIGEILKEERSLKSREKENMMKSQKIEERDEEIFQLKEELQKEKEKNRGLEDQIYDLRDINKQANRDLKLAIESVKAAQDLENRFNDAQNENSMLKKENIQLKKLKESEMNQSHFNEEELKEQFKLTIDEIKIKYEEVLEELGRQNEEKDQEIEELKNKLKSKTHDKGDLKKNEKFDDLSRKEFEKLLEDNYKLKEEKEDLLNEIEDLKGKINGISAREVREIRELKREIEEKNDNIQNLISQLEENSINGDAEEDFQRENEISQLNRELLMNEDKMKKNSFQLRMIYSRVTFILKRITGRTFIDKSKHFNNFFSQ